MMKEFRVTPLESDFEFFELSEGCDFAETWYTLGYSRAQQRVSLALFGKPEFRGREIEAILYALDHPELPLIQIQEIFRNGTDDAWNAEWSEIQRIIWKDAQGSQQDTTATAGSTEPRE